MTLDDYVSDVSLWRSRVEIIVGVVSVKNFPSIFTSFKLLL